MKNKALIITDGTAKIENIAHSISSVLNDYSVKICAAQKFEGTDLLPADVFFIGCEKSSPSSFSYIEVMLSHINLASRKCGIFSVNEDTIKYLRGIVEDCDAALGSVLYVKNEEIDKSALKNWVETIIKG